METSLQTYVHQRAANDLRMAEHFDVMGIFMLKGQHCRQALIEGNQQTPPQPCFVDKSMLSWAGSVGITTAGETAKVIERKRPDLKEANPNFPWSPLKRMRDHLAHPSRQHLRGKPTHNQQTDRDLRRIRQSYMHVKNFPRSEQLVRYMLFNTDFYLACDALRHYFHDQPIPISNHPKVSEICAHYRIHEQVFANLVINNYERGMLAAMCDSLDHASLFYSPDEKDKALQTRLLVARNRSAHGQDMLIHNDVEGRYIKDLETDFVLGDITSLLPVFNAIAEGFQKVMFHLKDPEKRAAGVEHLAQHYYKKLTAGITGDAQKLALLERTIDFATTITGLTQRQKDGYILVCGNMISKLPIDQAVPVLDYLEQDSNAYRTPAARQTLVTQAPRTVHAITQQFVRYLERSFIMPGEGLGLPPTPSPVARA